MFGTTYCPHCDDEIQVEAETSRDSDGDGVWAMSYISIDSVDFIRACECALTETERNQIINSALDLYSA